MIRYADLINDTICSEITPPGFGGVSVVRVSGAKAHEVVGSFLPSRARSWSSHRAFLARLTNPQNGKKIDEALVVFFAGGKSFTGDPAVEVSLHGNPSLVKNFINALCDQGCRLAERGEFSFRAFYNGKMDLTQAEAIQSLIMSESGDQASLALENLTGRFKESLEEIESELIQVMTQVEAAIDFSDRDIVTESTQSYSAKLKETLEKVKVCKSQFEASQALVRKKRIVIGGPPNAGKSSLFNLLVDENLALVSGWAGTTRDLISKDKVKGSTLYSFTDSAGIRTTKDPIEQMGIAKGLEALNQGDLVLWVNDVTEPLCSPPEELQGQSVLLVLNKIDQLKKVNASDGVGPESPGGSGKKLNTEKDGKKSRPNELSSPKGPVSEASTLEFPYIDTIWVSASTREGVEALEKAISDWSLQLSSSGVKRASNNGGAVGRLASDLGGISDSSMDCESGLKSKDPLNGLPNHLQNHLSSRCGVVDPASRSDHGSVLNPVFPVPAPRPGAFGSSAQSRHYTLLEMVFNQLSEAVERASSEYEMDLCSFHLQGALSGVQNLLGREFNDEILDSIFSGFCLGK